MDSCFETLAKKPLAFRLLTSWIFGAKRDKKWPYLGKRVALTLMLVASLVSTVHLQSMDNCDYANAIASFSRVKNGLKTIKMYLQEKLNTQLLRWSFMADDRLWLKTISCSILV